VAFRERMIAHEMDRVLLDRTVTLVRSGAMTEAEGRSVTSLCARRSIAAL